MADTENTPLLEQNRPQRKAEEIISWLKQTLYFLLKTIIFGGSITAGVQVYLEAWMQDIRDAGWESFDQHTVSLITTYTTLCGGLLGYLVHRRLSRGDVNNSSDYRLLKLAQMVDAFGLHAYLLKLFLFTVTEVCTNSFRNGGAVHYCPESSDNRVLEQFCCVGQNSADPYYPDIYLNEFAYMIFAGAAMKIVSAATPTMRYEFNKHPILVSLTNVLSVLPAIVSGIVINKIYNIKMPALYFSLIPLGLFHLSHSVAAIPIIGKTVDSNPDQPRGLIVYSSGFKKTVIIIFTGFGAGLSIAALVNSSGYALQMNVFEHPAIRYIGELFVASSLGFAVSYQIIQSRNGKDFLKKVLAGFLPRWVLEKIYGLPAQREQPVAQNEITRFANWKKPTLAFGVGLVTTGLTFSAIHFPISAIPAHDRFEMGRFEDARWERLSMAITFFVIFFLNSCDALVNLADDLGIRWPSFTDVTTFLIMSMSLYKAIEDDPPSTLYSFIPMALLFTLCLSGDKIGKLFCGNDVSSASEPTGIIIEEIQEDIQQQTDSYIQNEQSSPPAPRRWYDTWCSCFSSSSPRSQRHENKPAEKTHIQFEYNP